jgi:serine/threonine protein kinase
MEHYPLSLAALVAASSPIDRQLVVSLMEELLRGVGYLHERGVMHRDIKLENIMLKNTESGFRPVLIDLGMAQEFADSHYLFEKCGTPGYAAPEIFGQRSS